MVNIGLLLVVMESQTKFNFLTFDFEQALQQTLDDICYLTILTYFLKWRCNKVIYGQHLIT